MESTIAWVIQGLANIGPVFILESLMSFGSIWLRRSQSSHPSQSNNQTQLSKKLSPTIFQGHIDSMAPLENEIDDEDRPNQRHKKRVVSNQDRPPFITDTEPKEAYHMPLSDSDSK
ncbi:hypothetical protein HYC85_029579 [Camellia sinensis]|uniref:Uncharacterized protein n=1 Tax=Camellia sinensis TaxID=4442 RepID=A0A7J7G0U9_CAMSI|nr:hypothetical protein HYC85_029579 [Camellia sinensis]